MIFTQKQIFVVWANINTPITDNRRTALFKLIKHCNIDYFHIVTSYNIGLYNDKTFPIHKAYNLLSETHKADYLRAYLIYCYGGGYTDIKHNRFDWQPYFLYMIDHPQYEFIGYKERSPKDICIYDNMEAKQQYKNIGGVSCFIGKKHSSIMKQWIDSIHNKLDSIFQELQHNPGIYHPRAIMGGIHDGTPTDTEKYSGLKYPLGWNEICGRILHPILFHNQNKTKLIMPYPNIYSYR